jgi:hypothetical protein
MVTNASPEEDEFVDKTSVEAGGGGGGWEGPTFELQSPDHL